MLDVLIDTLDIDVFNWDAFVDFAIEAWESICNAVSQLVNGFVDFMHSVVAFWNEYGEAIEGTINSVKTFVRNAENILSRIYYSDGKERIWIRNAPVSTAISIDEVPETIRQTLDEDGKIGMIKKEEEEIIRERFA